MQSTEITPGDRLLHCDGSMIEAGTDAIAMAFGAVDTSETTIRTAQGRVSGHASSTKAELMGLLVAISSAPAAQDIIVRLDNYAVVQQYQVLVANRSSTLSRKRQRANFAALWAVLAKVVAERPGSTAVEWVRGHSTDHGNILADGVATSAVRRDTPAWQVDLSQQDELKMLATCAGTPTEMDVRQFLKQQTTMRHHQALLAQKTIIRAIPAFEEVEWRSTLSTIHDRRPVHTFFSSQSDTRNSTRRVKKLFGLLPTMNVMHARHPNLYENTTCRVCEAQPEDNDHIWHCQETAETQVAFWEEGIKFIDDWGKKAVARFNRNTKERHTRDLAVRRVNATPPAPKTWYGATDDAIWSSLAFIDGAIDLRDGRISLADNNQLGWSISSL
ncbi:hypothetical protein BGZ68_003571, partial [Mortierella alpina]